MCLAMNPDKLDAGRALRLDQQPQLRRPARQRRPHAPGLARHGRRRRDRRTFCRHSRVGLQEIASAVTDARQRLVPQRARHGQTVKTLCLTHQTMSHATHSRHLAITKHLTAHATLHQTHRPGRPDGSGQRRYRSDHSQAVPEADRADRLRPVPVFRLAVSRRRLAEPELRTEPAAVSRAPAFCWRGATSAAARAASMPPGPWRITASTC